MLSVMPAYQGKQIGHNFIRMVEDEAIEKNYDRISLKVDAKKPRALALYERLVSQCH